MPPDTPSDATPALDRRLLRSAVLRVAVTALLAAVGVLTWSQVAMHNDTEAFYRTTLAKNPGAWMAHNNLGVYLQEHKLPGAQAEFEAALRLQPDYVPAQYNLGVSLLASGHPEEAVAHLEKAAGTQHRKEVHLYLGAALTDLHRYGEAAAEYSLYAQVEPASGAAWLGLGNALASEDRLSDAVPALAKAMQILPENPEAAFSLGDALVGLKRYAGAAAAYRQGLARAPDRTEARINLGNALVLCGQTGAAVAEFREALRRQPGDPALQKSLQWALDVQANGGAPAP